MYEQFRNQLSVLLLKDYGAEEVNRIMESVDKVASGYTFAVAETAVIPYEYATPAAVQMWLACKKLEGKSDKTLANYQIILNLFFKMVGKAVSDISTNDIRTFLYAYQAQKGISNRTLDKYKDYINHFFEWAKNEGIRADNPCAKIPKIKYEYKQREAMTQTELEYIRSGCADLRDKALVELLYSTGCRASEVVNIKLTDVNWNRKEIRVTGKGQKQRTVFLNARAEVALKKYIENRACESEWLICKKKIPYTQCSVKAVEDIIKGVCERAGTKKVSPHVFRHTTATTALQNGMGIESISKMLGHASVSTTMIYAECSDEKLHQDHLRFVI